jgi:hypothetical protein
MEEIQSVEILHKVEYLDLFVGIITLAVGHVIEFGIDLEKVFLYCPYDEH